MKALRSKLSPKLIRFFNSGEYGSPTSENNYIARPHWHTIIFGHEFTDLVPYKKTKAGTIFTSAKLEKIWGKGFCSVVELTQQTANYVARYSIKKINGDRAQEHYEKICPTTGDIQNVRPEFSTQSRRPGIAKAWYEKYKTDVFPHDMVIMSDGTRVKTPRYYDALLQSESLEQYERIKKDREEYGLLHLKDSTLSRLKTRETVKKASIKTLSRGLI